MTYGHIPGGCGLAMPDVVLWDWLNESEFLLDFQLFKCNRLSASLLHIAALWRA